MAEDRDNHMMELASRPSGIIARESPYSVGWTNRYFRGQVAAKRLFSLDDGSARRYFASQQAMESFVRNKLAFNSRMRSENTVPGVTAKHQGHSGPIVIPPGVRITYGSSHKVDPRYQVEKLDESTRLFGSMATGRKPEVRAV